MINYLDCDCSLFALLQKVSNNVFFGLRIKLGFNLEDFNLFCNGMHVQDTLISWGNQLLVFRDFEDVDGRLEFVSLLTVVQIIADHMTSLDIIWFDIIEILHFQLNILAAHGKGKTLVFGVVDFFDDGLGSWGQDGDGLVFYDRAWFNFTVKVQVFGLFIFVDNGDSQRSDGLSFKYRKSV